MKKIFKRITSFFVIVTMLMSLFQLGVFATGNDEITVYLTLSVDGDFVTSGVTGDKMARIPITLSYFDLADYGLEKYYRYETDSDGGEYINTTVVEQPTLLHLYIKALEQYYIGGSYDASNTKALNPSGEATSFYMLKFWGHDENLMYFVDHKYPLMSTGWGATADYVLLEDGMEVDVAMFSSWDFYNSGYFTYFENGDEITVSQGDTVDFSVMGTSTAMTGETSEYVALGSDLVSVYYGKDLSNLQQVSENSDGKYSITFTDAGEYYVAAKDVNCGDTELACIAPAVTKVNVEAPASTGEYEVTVNVGPSTANVKFYKCTGFDANGYDILGDEIAATDNGVDADTSYHVYTMNVDAGTYSFRATDADGNSLGGMTFDVPIETEVDSTETKTAEVYLRQVDVYTTTQIDSAYADESQYSTQVMDADGRLATVGKAYLDSSSRTRYPYFLYANGNAELYTVKLIPSEAVAAANSLGTNTMINYTVSKGTTLTTKSGTLPTLINAVITAPTGSTVQVFNQLRNFYTEEVAYSSKAEADGVTSYTFRLPKNNGNHTYRVSMKGKITKAGYLKLTSEDTAKVDITFAESENPEIRPEYDTSTTIGSRLEDNIVLNINEQNYLRMSRGDTFKARAYRAWQIINSDTANIMIEPDFEYKIISGDSVALEQQGQNAVLTAVKDGISIIEVTYDAIEIGGNTSYTGIYGAIDPMRKGLFIVNVGGDTATEITLPEWDSDFDTVYFLGETGTYDFAPSSGSVMTVKCNDEEVAANDDGTYTLTINQGNNIVSVTAGNTTEYIIVKGNKVTANIENVTSPDQPIKQGDTVNISFKGLHMPMPKFSGIYNPGFGGTIKVSYSTSSGGKLQSKGAQYNFINNHTISFVAYDKGTVKLTDGSIPLTSMGFVPGAHRELTDTGVGANFNASAVPAEFSILPDVSVEVLKNDDLSYMETASDTYCNLANVNILCGTSIYAKSFGFALTTEAKASVQNSNTTFTSINSSYPFTVTATPVNEGVKMKFSYWELGDTEKKTVSLTPGETVTLANEFTATKPIYMELEVKPENPVFGEGKVYSYVAYKNTTGFERPILKTLNIKDGEGAAFAAPYGVLYSDNGQGVAYTQTDYYCYIPTDCESVTLSVARLIGAADATVGEETLSSLGTTETAFSSAIATENDETEVSILLSDGATYKVTLKKTDKPVEKSVVYDEEIIAVSFANPVATVADFYVVSFDEKGVLTKAEWIKKELASGENSVYIDWSGFKSLDNVKLYVWNEELTPIINKTDIDYTTAN